MLGIGSCLASVDGPPANKRHARRRTNTAAEALRCKRPPRRQRRHPRQGRVLERALASTRNGQNLRRRDALRGCPSPMRRTGKRLKSATSSNETDSSDAPTSESTAPGPAVPAGEIPAPHGSRSRAEPLRRRSASKLVCSPAIVSPRPAARPPPTSPAISSMTSLSRAVGVSRITSAGASSAGRCFARSHGQSSSYETLGGARPHQGRWRRRWSSGSGAKRVGIRPEARRP